MCHLIHHIDGKTSGPSSFTGPTGSKLNDCEKQPVTDFKSIDSENIILESSDLSTDQEYLLKSVQLYCIASGECNSELALMNTGKLQHGRWLTTANRILCLYVSLSILSSGMLVIVNYIMKVCVPMWFAIKKNTLAFQGAKRLYEMIRKSCPSQQGHRTVVDKVIQNIAYFTNPENLLFAMIHDDSATIRELGFRRILRARHLEQDKPCVTIPYQSLIINASAYHLMIDWRNIELTEPPATKKITSKDVLILIPSKEKPFGLSDFPCHTHVVERLIKMVTDTSTVVVGEAARDSYMRAWIEGRKKLPKFKTMKIIM